MDFLMKAYQEKLLTEASRLLQFENLQVFSLACSLLYFRVMYDGFVKKICIISRLDPDGFRLNYTTKCQQCGEGGFECTVQ